MMLVSHVQTGPHALGPSVLPSRKRNKENGGMRIPMRRIQGVLDTGIHLSRFLPSGSIDY